MKHGRDSSTAGFTDIPTFLSAMKRLEVRGRKFVNKQGKLLINVSFAEKKHRWEKLRYSQMFIVIATSIYGGTDV